VSTPLTFQIVQGQPTFSNFNGVDGVVAAAGAPVALNATFTATWPTPAPTPMDVVSLIDNGSAIATQGLSGISPYPELLQELETRIRSAQVRASLAVSRELVLLYWSIGRDIFARQDPEGWGTRVIERLCSRLAGRVVGCGGVWPAATPRYFNRTL
jgi:hypothetical protein